MGAWSGVMEIIFFNISKERLRLRSGPPQIASTSVTSKSTSEPSFPLVNEAYDEEFNAANPVEVFGKEKRAELLEDSVIILCVLANTAYAEDVNAANKDGVLGKQKQKRAEFPENSIIIILRVLANAAYAEDFKAAKPSDVLGTAKRGKRYRLCI
ncbi:hypothetical protein BDZ45DRAFT_732887 [Acephala macrosclerotiorum]|nr:hypothetical protein BDZ45DRAFT_732887 [Acephala macrosclerotiorum]